MGDGAERRGGFVALVVASTLVIATCSQNGGDRGSSPTTTASATTTLTEAPTPVTTSGDGADNEPNDLSILTALGYVPDAETSREAFSYRDYAATKDALGIDELAEPATEQAVAEHLLTWYPMLGTETWYRTFYQANFSRPIEVAAWRDDFGFSVLDTAIEIIAGRPPITLWLIASTTSPDEIAAAVRANPQWRPALQVREEAGATVFDWGEGANLSNSTTTRILGEAGQLALVDGLAVRTLRAADLSSVLAARSDDQRSLADDPDYRAIAQRLDRMGAASATIRSPGPAHGPDLAPDRPVLSPYAAIGAGHVIEDGKSTGVLIIAHASAEEAAANATALDAVLDERPLVRALDFTWRAGLGEPDVRIEDNLLIARFPGGDGHAWLLLDTALQGLTLIRSG